MEMVRDPTTGLVSAWNGYNGTPESKRLFGYYRDADSGLITAQPTTPDFADLYMQDAAGLVGRAKAQYDATATVLDFAIGFFQNPASGVQSNKPSTSFAGWSCANSGGYAETVAGLLVPFAANLPRWTDKGLLVEEGRTNLFLQSFTPATQTITLAATGSYAISVWGGGSVAIAAGSATITGAGSASKGAPLIINCTVIGTITATVTGSPTAVNVEAGAFGTSPIATAGAPVARAADQIKITGLAAPALSTFLTEFDTLDTSGVAGQHIAGLATATEADVDLVSNYLSGTTRTQFARVANVLQLNAGVVTGSGKQGVVWDGATYRGTAGGGAVATGGATPLPWDRMVFGNPGPVTGSRYVKRARYYPRAFSDAELQAATT